MIYLGMAMTLQHLLFPPPQLINVEDVESEIPGNVIHDLRASINPIQQSNSYGIDLFTDCLKFCNHIKSLITNRVCTAN